MLSIAIIMKEKNLRWKDLDVSTCILGDARAARRNITLVTLKKIDNTLKTGNLQFLYLLDRLYFVSNKEASIKPEGFSFPPNIPKKIQKIIVNYHPIFI